MHPFVLISLSSSLSIAVLAAIGTVQPLEGLDRVHGAVEVGPRESDDAERAEARLEEIRAEFERIQMALVKRHQAAKTEEERRGLPDYNLGPWADVKPDVVRAARDFAGTPGAVPFLLWTVGSSVRTAEHGDAIAAIEELLASHAADERVIRVANSLPRYRRTLGVERALELAKAYERAVPGVESRAAFALASVQIERPEGDRLSKALGALIARYPETRAARNAAGWKFEMERLQVGMTVPDVAGTTLDGEPFRLSEHRGKVVVLEFWAVNCGPCLEKMPRSAERVRRLQDQPFLHVGIQSCSGTPAAAKERLRARGANWPVLADRATDGGSFGPIGTRWHLSGWPTVFLIDHEGVIRSNWATESVLEEMLPELLERAAER